MRHAPQKNFPECLPSILAKGKPHYAAVAMWHRQNSEILSSPDSLLQNFTPEFASYDARLAERLDDLVGGMFNMELATMSGSGGYRFLMNGHMCVFIWGDRLVIQIGEAAANAIAKQPRVGLMDFTGSRMRGWAAITYVDVAEDPDLQRCVDMAILFRGTLPAKEAKTRAKGSRKTTRNPN